jgi:hypothetical protein
VRQPAGWMDALRGSIRHSTASEAQCRLPHWQWQIGDETAETH